MPRSYKKKNSKGGSSRVVRHGEKDSEDPSSGASGVFNPLQLPADLFHHHLVFRILVVEVPLFLLLASTLISHGLLDIHAKYGNKFLRSLQFTNERQEWEQTYPRMECGANDLTEAITDPRLLFVRDNDTYLDATEKVLEHGAAVLPELLSVETSLNLRRYIQKRNGDLQQSEELNVIMNDHRTSFTLSAVEHPSVARALREIGHNEMLVDTLEALLGFEPSLMEFQVITSREGASAQYFHADTPPRYSASMSQFTFHPLYTLLVPLQDTSPEQGPTAVCPGSHRCYFTASCFGFGDDHGDNTTEQVGVQVVDPLLGYWEAGQGLLYSSSVAHRGTSHVKGQDQVVLILSFTGKPDHSHPSQFSRFPPLGSVYGIKWFHAGQTLSDLKDPHRKMGYSLTRWTGLLDRDRLAWSSFRFDQFRAAAPDQYRFRAEDLKDQKLQHSSIMGMLSAVFFVDVQPLTEHNQHFSGDTEYHAVLLLERIRVVCLVLVGIVALCYMCVVAIVDNSWLLGVIARIVLVLVILWGSYEWAHAEVDSSLWATDIRAENIEMVPPETPRLPISEEYSRHLPTPTIQDVLLDSLPSKLAAQAYRLDYLPGNMRWRTIAKQQSKFYLLYQASLPAVFKQAVLNFIIDRTQTTEAKSFYKRNTLNDFIEVSWEEALQNTKLLMMEQILYPHKRLGVYTDRFHCSEDSRQTLCNSKPQVLLDMFNEVPHSNSPTQAQGLTTYRPRVARKPTCFTNSTCKRKLKPHKSSWEVGDIVQAQLDRSEEFPSRKWVNAKVVGKTPDGLYHLKAFNVDAERAVLEGYQLREPHHRQPSFWALMSASLDLQSRTASLANCLIELSEDELKCDRSSLSLNQHNPEMARVYTAPEDTEKLEVLFEFEEAAASAKGFVFVRLEQHDLELGQFDPDEEDLIEWGYFDDVYVRVTALSPTRNKVGLNIPRRWLLGGNELVFGVRVELGVEVEIDEKIVVLATLQSGKIVPIFNWGEE